MSKMKQIAALTAMLVGVIMYASPAKCAVCFLPDDDGSCGGGDIEISDGSGSDDDKPVKECSGFTVSATNYDKMKDCFNFTYCTKSKTKEVVYKKGGKKSNTHWYPNWNACCTGGTAYDLREGKCCPAGGCVHDECDAPKVWSSILGNCVCPADREENTTSNTCCPVGEHADGAICCPDKKHNEGGECKCDSKYNTDKNGNCVLPNNCTYAYRQATTADSCGLKHFENTTKCMDSINGCLCYTQLQKVSSVYAGSAGTVIPLNKISNTSATCIDENNVTRYQTICPGTPESGCTDKDKEFKPNGCVSDTYNNGFEVKGVRWGDCVKKEETCLYEYTMLTTKDTGGVTDISGQSLRYSKNWNDKCYKEGRKIEKTSTCYGYEGSNGTYSCGGTSDGPKCTNPGSSCKITQTCTMRYNCPTQASCGIADNPSVYSEGIFVGSHWSTPYNRISNASASCTTIDGVTKYQTICEGTPKQKCDKKFTPNNCVSSDYSNGVQVLGAEWGTCGCDTDKGYYDSMETCRSNANSDGCMTSNIYGCYQTCKSRRGYFSTLEDCRDTTYSVSCNKTDDCYERRMQGFLIKYETDLKLLVDCHSPYSYTVRVNAFLMDVTKNKYSGLEEADRYSTTISGEKHIALPVDTSKGYQYTAGTYYLCYQSSCSSSGSNNQKCPNVSVKSVQLLKQSDYNDEFNYDMCFSGSPSSAGTFGGKKCVAYDYSSNNYACKKVTFDAGKTYKIRFDISYPTASCRALTVRG